MKFKYKQLGSWLIAWSMLFGILLPTLALAEIKKIIVRYGTESDALNIVLATTIDDYRPYELIDSKRMTIGRSIQRLIDNSHINFISFSTNHNREEKLLPIMWPLNDGLLGYRP